MHPANSVILFTTLSGLGFGMMTWLGLGLGPADPAVGPVWALLALILSGAGLMASTFHLGNPQRAWRAFSQWRSSWLSREGVVSVVLMIAFTLYAGLWALGERVPALGYLSAALSLLAVLCTAMIYAQLKTVPRWSSPFTVPMFFGFSQAGGALACALGAAMAGEAIPIEVGMSLLFFSALIYVHRRASTQATLAGSGSTPETATQLKGRVRLLEKPHSGENYLMKEMVFRVGRRHADKLALIATIIGLFTPLFLFILFREPGAYGMPAALQIVGLTLALTLHFAGALVSRWLFFAEAEHVVGLYYGQR